MYQPNARREQQAQEELRPAFQGLLLVFVFLLFLGGLLLGLGSGFLLGLHVRVGVGLHGGLVHAELDVAVNPQEDILEDISIYWNDELEYALSWCCRTMESIGKGKPWALPELFMSEMPGSEGKESDRSFVYNLLRTACRNYDRYYQMVSDVTPKWDTGRICATDLALIICGLAEADAFPNIDYRTTINEFVEISKYYSTPESRAFVNGVLDKLINKK